MYVRTDEALPEDISTAVDEQETFESTSAVWGLVTVREGVCVEPSLSCSPQSPILLDLCVPWFWMNRLLVDAVEGFLVTVCWLVKLFPWKTFCSAGLIITSGEPKKRDRKGWLYNIFYRIIVTYRATNCVPTPKVRHKHLASSRSVAFIKSCILILVFCLHYDINLFNDYKSCSSQTSLIY